MAQRCKAKCIYNTPRLITAGIVGQLNQVKTFTKLTGLQCNLICALYTYRLSSADMKLLCGLYVAGSLYMLHTIRSLQRSFLTPSCSMILSIFSNIGL